jgi:hypothetical protein
MGRFIIILHGAKNLSQSSNEYFSTIEFQKDIVFFFLYEFNDFRKRLM